MRTYAGYIKDVRELKSTSSGGAVTAISKEIIKNGGVVFGVRYSLDFKRAEYCMVTSVDDLGILKGSKYTETYKGNTFKSICDELLQGKTVLFIGLGCDVASVIRICQKNNVDITNLYTIELICHGPVPSIVHSSYIEEIENKYHSKLASFTVKYKKHGWTPTYIKAIFKNGKKMIVPFEESDYGKAFSSIVRPQCSCCKYKGQNHEGDLCCGDFWGIRKNMQAWNREGVSIIIEQSPKGRKLIELLTEDFFIHEEEYDFAIKGNPMYNVSRSSTNDYKVFIDDISVNGLSHAVSVYCSSSVKKLSAKEKIKRWIMKVL